jgi:ATP/maltotriose-dependent transcriptional regulator MalT
MSVAERIALKPKYPVRKPAKTEFTHGVRRDVVVVKFVDGAQIREKKTSAARRMKTDEGTLLSRLETLKPQLAAYRGDHETASERMAGVESSMATTDFLQSRTWFLRARSLVALMRGDLERAYTDDRDSLRLWQWEALEGSGRKLAAESGRRSLLQAEVAQLRREQCNSGRLRFRSSSRPPVTRLPVAL